MSEEEASVASNSTSDERQGKKAKRKHEKEKPWDTDDIDHWKIDPVDKEDPLPAPLEESSFATLFPKYREKYIREFWPQFTTALKHHGIRTELNLLEGSMTVATTRKTWDPYAIIKSRDFMKLLARSVPFHQAQKIMNDGVNCDIIKIGNVVRNRERFVKRRQRLLGPNGSTLKALELLTDCYVMVQGNTVAAMGGFKGLKTVRKVVTDCMKNIHPIYHIKTLMIKRELAKNEDLAGESWDRFLPQFKKKNVPRKKPKKIRERKEYTPFPPAPVPSKVDLALESGEYFLSESKREKQSRAQRAEKRQQAAKDKKAKRQKVFEPPKETKKAKKNKNVDASASDLEALKKKLKKKLSDDTAASSSAGGSDFIFSKKSSSSSSSSSSSKTSTKKKKKKSKSTSATSD